MFPDERFDLVITQDVMEHVNQPEAAFREIARTLRRGGAYVFSVPTYKGLVKSERIGEYVADEFLSFGEPEYHGNPINANGSPVTFHYGYDLAELIRVWSGLDVVCLRFSDRYLGIIGEITEIYVCRKR